MSDNKFNHIDELAKKIREHAEIKAGEVKDGTVRLELSDDVFEKTLPEDLNLKSIKLAQTHIRNFAAALAIVTGDEGTNVMKENAEVKTVIAPIHAGHQKVTGVLLRQYESRNPTNDTVTMKHGHATVKLSMSVPNGLVTHFRNTVANRFAEAGLGK